MKINQYGELSSLSKLLSKNEKSFSKLHPGEVFRAQIIDIMQGKLLLRLNDGTAMEAKLQNQILEMKIGETMFFKVQVHSNEQILLEMLTNQNENPKIDIIIDALDAANLLVHSDNITMVENLLDKHLPIDSKHLQTVSYLLKSNPNLSLEQLLFLMNNDMEINQKNIFLLNGYVDHTISLQKQVENLIDDIYDIKDKDIIEDILNHIMEIQPEDKKEIPYRPYWDLEKERESLNLIAKNAKPLPENQEMPSYPVENDLENGLKSMFFQDKKDNSKKSFIVQPKALLNELKNDIHIPVEQLKNPLIIKQNLNKLYQYLLQIENALKKNPTPETSKASKITEEIKNNLKFMNHLNKYESFIQIPIKLNHYNTQAELYVFQKNKKLRKNANTISALIALDLNSLGHLEAFVQKNDKELYCQFRLENIDSKDLIKSHMGELIRTLSDKGYKVKSITFQEIKEPFNLLKFSSKNNETQEEPKRYSFDMRV
ncbi:MAG: flagellar hook-length control protein FliK [Epulopiscium sp.]|nr:flagellar hook-length control protein FliK [Candidatus Epulonipiscium sp.]